MNTEKNILRVLDQKLKKEELAFLKRRRFHYEFNFPFNKTSYTLINSKLGSCSSRSFNCQDTYYIENNPSLRLRWKVDDQGFKEFLIIYCHSTPNLLQPLTGSMKILYVYKFDLVTNSRLIILKKVTKLLSSLHLKQRLVINKIRKSFSCELIKINIDMNIEARRLNNKLKNDSITKLPNKIEIEFPNHKPKISYLNQLAKEFKLLN